MIPDGEDMVKWMEERRKQKYPDQEGLRYNDGKTPFEFIPLQLLEDCAKVFKHVTQRKERPYPMWNWLKDKPVSVAYAALMRHMTKWYSGEDIDPETGLSHLGHAMCNLLMLTRHIQNPLNDDRPTEFFKAKAEEEFKQFLQQRIALPVPSDKESQ